MRSLWSTVTVARGQGEQRSGAGICYVQIVFVRRMSGITADIAPVNAGCGSEL